MQIPRNIDFLGFENVTPFHPKTVLSSSPQTEGIIIVFAAVSYAYGLAVITDD